MPGFWEGDLIIGQGGRSQIATLVERATRYVMLVRVPYDRTADRVAIVLAQKMATLPQFLRNSITWDQGKEMAAHARFTVATGIPVYFCDPHSPWQLLCFYCSLTVLSRDIADAEVVAGSSPWAWRGRVCRWKRSCLRCSPAGCH